MGIRSPNRRRLASTRTVSLGVLLWIGILLVHYLVLHGWYHQFSKGLLQQPASLHPASSQYSYVGLREEYFPRGAGQREVWAAGSSWEKDASLAPRVHAQLSAQEAADVEALCGRCLYHTARTCLRPQGSLDYMFVTTGDIPDMWIRDSAVQVGVYMPRIARHPALRKVVEGTLRMQAFFITQDPYGNSFKPEWRESETWPKEDRGQGRGGWVAERKYELDSGAYYLSMLWNYFNTPGLFGADAFLNQSLIFDAAQLMVDTWRVEQHHEEQSPFMFPMLPRQGKGNPTKYTGMVWSACRPSDDVATYGYSIPGNMYAVAALERALQLNLHIWHSRAFEEKASQLVADIKAGIEQYGIVTAKDGVRMYAYEVDGLGNALTDFDDPNIPSLLSVPFLSYRYYDAAVYNATRERLFSRNNSYYLEGEEIRGLGSPHTPAGYIWPLSLMAQGLTSPDPAARAALFRQLLKMQCGNGLMHESVDMNDLNRCTRPWFEWANAMLVVLVENSLGISCEGAAQAHRLSKIKAREAGRQEPWPFGVEDRPELYGRLETDIHYSQDEAVNAMVA